MKHFMNISATAGMRVCVSACLCGCVSVCSYIFVRTNGWPIFFKEIFFQGYCLSEDDAFVCQGNKWDYATCYAGYGSGQRYGNDNELIKVFTSIDKTMWVCMHVNRGKGKREEALLGKSVYPTSTQEALQLS